jgi:hypothetical protein
MTSTSNPMEKFDFLLGTWELEYRVPKSVFSEAASGKGTGTFKRMLNDKYVSFDYSAKLSTGSTAAHAIFAWDEKSGIYRYWWFEDSGAFLTATCNFIDEEILFLNWHDMLLIQTFSRITADKVILRMEHPVAQGKFEVILEVILKRR